MDSHGAINGVIQGTKNASSIRSDCGDPVHRPQDRLNAILTPEKSVLILIDHQPLQFANLHSREPAMIVNNVVELAKAAKG